MSRNSRKRGLSVSAQRPGRTLGERFSQGRHLTLECLEERRLLSLNPIISEVDPGNKTGIVDAAGVAADWLEIYNPDPTTAVNLSGWSINYAKTNTTWTIPNNVVLGPGEFRVVFCDATPTTDPVGELHTNFNLSKSGSTLELINASSAVVSSLTYPALSSDTSYGPGETVTETDLVAAGATATYYAPTSNALGTTWTQPSFNDSSWASGPTGLGFANTVPGFAATLYRSDVTYTIGSVETAESVITVRRVHFGNQPDRARAGFRGCQRGRPLHQLRDGLSRNDHRRRAEQHRHAGHRNIADLGEPGWLLHLRSQLRRRFHPSDHRGQLFQRRGLHDLQRQHVGV